MNGQPVHLQVGEWAVPYEEGREALGRRLLPHQAFLAGAPAGAYVVHTPTGSGKTFAALLRYLERAKAEPGPFFGLMVYPTNALLEDQARQLKLAVETGGWRASMLPEEESQTDFGLLVTSGEMLGPSGGKGRQLETALDLLLRRYQRGLWLTNPDTLFYLFQLYYRHAGESLKYLSAFRYWVLDEFHLYEGGLLAEVVFLLDRVAGRAVQDLVVMTATPSAAADLVRRWWPDMQEVGLRSVNPANSARIIRHSMDLTVHPANGRFSLRNEAALRRLLTIIEATFEDTSLETLGGEATARTLVIVDSVAVANYLYRALCDRYGSSEVGAIHGFVPAGHRIMRPLTIGTRAVEVGVDFDTASLVMEGHDVPTALQRLGRAGRHRPAVVHWYLSDAGASRLFSRLTTDLPANGMISAQDFAEVVQRDLPSPDAWESFLDSAEGAALYLALWTRVIQALAKRNGERDMKPDQLKQWLQQVIPEARAVDPEKLRVVLNSTYPPRFLNPLARAPFRGGHAAVEARWAVEGQEGWLAVDIADLNRLEWSWDGPELTIVGISSRRRDISVSLTETLQHGRLYPPQQAMFVHGLESSAIGNAVASKLRRQVVAVAEDYLDWRLSGLPLAGSDQRRAYFGIDGLVATWLSNKKP